MIIGQEKITGGNLFRILNDEPYLQQVDVKYTILYLLENGYINPSTISLMHINILWNKNTTR